MKIAVFSTRPNDQASLVKANGARHSLAYFEAHLSRKSAAMAANAKAVCAFVNDQLDRSTLELLGQGGTRLVALRCTGFNNVDLDTAAEFDITIASVPAYYPHAVAERTAALILSFNRHIRRADARVREGYFSLDWLLGLDMQGRPVGIVGTGKIGLVLGRI